MNKKEFISRVSETLRQNNLRKPVSVKKHTFHISDDEGNEANFVIKKQDKNVLYNADDVENILEACLTVALEAIKRGEPISFRGFGSLGVHYRKARQTKKPQTDEWCDVAARYVPKFYFGNDLRVAAKLYELSLPENTPPPEETEDEWDGDI